MDKRLTWVFVLCVVCSVLFGPAPVIAQPDAAPEQLKRKLVVGVMTGPPWSMKDDDGAWTGITVDLWREIAEFLKLTYEFKEYDLEGVLKAVETGTVDAAATGLAITIEREAKFDFSDPYFVFNQTVAVNADQQPSLANVFRSTFLNWSFVSLLLLMIAVTLMGATFLWLLEQRGDSEEYSGKHKKAFAKSLFWSVMVLAGRDLPQSIGWTTSAPKTTPARLFAIVWMLVGVMLFSLFTAGAASLLTSKQLQSIVNSPDDLRHVRVGTVIGAAAQAYLNRRNIKYVTYETPVDLLQALVGHKIDAAVYGGTTLSYYAQTLFANKIVVLRFALRQDFAAIPLPYNSPLRKPINSAILHVLESKKWQTLVSKYVTSE